MKEIPLTRGYVAIVDDCDYDYLMQWKWSAAKDHWTENRFYAQSREKQGKQYKTIKMHRKVLELAGFKLEGWVVDHINGDGLLNTRVNLRLATHGQNITSSHQSIKNKNGYRGVWKNARQSKTVYTAEIRFERKKYKLGTFATAEEAAHAYNEAAIRLFGKFARLNVIPSTLQQSAV